MELKFVKIKRLSIQTELEDVYDMQLVKNHNFVANGLIVHNCIFQEQISQLVSTLGKNISLEEGNEVRKLLTKRGIGPAKEKLEKFKIRFIEGCREKKIAEKTGLAIWDMLDRFSQYSFCKCLSGDTLVTLEDGKKEKIKDVQIGSKVESANGLVRVIDRHRNGKKKVFLVKTKNGREIKCTLDHKFQTKNGMKTLEEILESKVAIICKSKSKT
jgi:DNA polymerase-3 subunit alpha